MMKSLGIIVEFNPFHQGHKYFIEKAMKASDSEICVAVMSGNFVQRGNPAIFDKWSRAQKAIENGVNVVIELPTVFACNSAEYFAAGAVKILEGLGCIDSIAFGSEMGDLKPIQETANFLKDNDKKLKLRIQELLKEGHSHPKARELAIFELNPDLDRQMIKQPNNILGIEYLKQLETIKPYTIKRRGTGYHQSATQLRQQLYDKDPESFDRVEKSYFDLACAKILQMDGSQLEKIFSAGEGLGNKLKNEIRYVSSKEQLIYRIKSKAYTYSRVSRLITQVILDIDKDAVSNGAKYARILALDNAGAKFIKEIKKGNKNRLPIITNINKELREYPEIRKTINLDILASDIYNIINENNLYEYSDYIMKPYIQT